MQIEMLVPMSGNADARYNQPEFSYVAGQIVDVAPALGNAWIDAKLAVAVSSPGGPQFAEEVPAGVIDGVNDTFTLENVPNPPGSLTLFNTAGMKLRSGGVDYTLTGNQIVYAAAAIPPKNALHDCSYRF